MESQCQQPPPGGLCPIHCVAWYGNVMALRLLMKTGKVLIDYQDMYGNTALHYATFNGHDDFANLCIHDFDANLMLVNNGEQSVLGIINDAKLALVPNDDWTVEMATTKALAATRKAKDDGAPIGHAIAGQAVGAVSEAPESGVTDQTTPPE